MLILETVSSDAATALTIARTCEPVGEAYVAEGEVGILVLCEERRCSTPSAAARAVKILFTEGRCGEQGGAYLFKVGLWAPVEYRDELITWYRYEHLPILLECPTWDGCRFSEETVNDGCQFHTLHQLSHPDALESEERKRSRSTPWFLRLKRNEWFDERFTRKLYKRVD